MSERKHIPLKTLHRSAVSIFFCIYGFIFSNWVSRIPDIKVTLGMSDEELGIVLLGLPIGQLCAMALSGYIVSKFQSKRPVICTLVLYPTVLLLIGVVETRWQLMGSLFLFGAVSNLFNISVNTQAVNVEKLYAPKKVMSTFHGLWSLGGFSAGLVGTLFVGLKFSPIVQFVVTWVLALIVLAVTWRYLVPRDSKSKPLLTAEGKGGFRVDGYVVALGLIAFCAMAAEGVMLDWSGVFFRQVLTVEEHLVTYGFVAFMAAFMTARFLIDFFVTRFGERNVLQVTGFFISAGLLLSYVANNIWVAATAFALVGFGVSAGVPLAYSLAGRHHKIKSSTAITLVSTISFCGFLVTPPIVGFISEAIGLKTAFAIMAVAGLMITILSRIALRTEKGTQCTT